MTHFFEKRDLWGNRLSLWIVVLMAFVMPISWWSLRQLQIESDAEKWLPSNDPEQRALRWSQEQFPIEERILLTWDGSFVNDTRAAKLVELLVGQPDRNGIKRGGLPYISSVMEPMHILKVMQENGIPPQEAAKRLEGTILGTGSLRLQLTETGRSALKRTKRELQIAFRARYGMELVIHDPTPDLTPLISIPVPGESPETQNEPSSPAILTPDGQLAQLPSLDHDLQVSWTGMRVGSERTIEIASWLTEYVPGKGDRQPLVNGSFFAIGSPIAIVVGISEAGLADKAETVAAIRAAGKQVGIPGESLRMAGSVVTASELNAEVRKAVWDTSVPLIEIHRRSVLISSVLVSALLAFLLLRSMRLAALILLVSVGTAFSATALLPVTGGSMNPFLIVMPTLLLVLTMQGAIHFVGYWKHAACHDETKAIVDTVRLSWSSCISASLTASIGLISLCTSRMTPVREFGIYAASGMIFSLIVLTYGLPSLMQFWSRPTPREQEIEFSGWRFLGQLLTSRSDLQILMVMAICAGLSLGISRLRTETKVIRYFPDQSKIAHDYSYIESNLGGVLTVDNIIRFDEQSQKDTNFLDRMELIRQIQTNMAALTDVSGAASLADFHAVNEQPPEDAGFLLKTKHNKKATMIQQRIRDGQLENARSYYTITDPGRELWESSDPQLNQTGDELWRITVQVNLMTGNDFSKVLADLHKITQDVLKLQPGSRHLITGSVPLFVRTQQAALQSLVNSSALALVLVLMVLLFHLRSLGAAIAGMIPALASIAVVVGAFSWMQQRIDVCSMMTVPIGLGVAAVGSLYSLTWVQIAMKKGCSRRDAIIEGLVHAGPGMWQTSIIVAAGLLMLVPAELRVISRFGAFMTAITAVAMLSNTVLLPQLLGGSFGWLFTPKIAADVTTSNETKNAPDQPLETPGPVDGQGPPPPHIKPIDPNRKNRRPTA